MPAVQTNPIKELYGRLDKLGVPKKFVRSTLLPSWWDDSAAKTPAGYAEALTYVSKRLGVSLDVLRGKVESPSLSIHPSRVKFKLTKGSDEKELVIARNLAAQVARQAAIATTVPFGGLPQPSKIREAILASGRPWVSFEALVDYLWAAGVPVLHVDRFPPGAKKMQGMTANVEGRPVVIVSKNNKQGAWLLFIVAHETGHAVLGHVESGEVLVDERIVNDDTVVDAEEKAANAAGVEILCGDPAAKFVAPKFLPNAHELAAEAKKLGVRLKVDPGHIALNYGNSMTEARGSSFFPVAQAAAKELDPNADAVGFLRARMLENLDLSRLSDENAEFVRLMTGVPDDDA